MRARLISNSASNDLFQLSHAFSVQSVRLSSTWILQLHEKELQPYRKQVSIIVVKRMGIDKQVFPRVEVYKKTEIPIVISNWDSNSFSPLSFKWDSSGIIKLECTSVAMKIQGGTGTRTPRRIHHHHPTALSPRQVSLDADFSLESYMILYK